MNPTLQCETDRLANLPYHGVSAYCPKTGTSRKSEAVGRGALETAELDCSEPELCFGEKQSRTNGSRTVRILIVDAHPALRSGIRHTLATHPGMATVGEAATGASALKLAEELTPDLVVMDVHLPDQNGLAVSRQILDAYPATKIIIFSSDAAQATVDQALRAGVCGYLLKTSPVEDLVQAIGSVRSGKLYFGPDVSAVILAEYRTNTVSEPMPAKPFLAQREIQLLRLVADGCRNKEIAAQLAISVKSVEASRSRLMKKLNCFSLAELIRYAIRGGIVAL